MIARYPRTVAVIAAAAAVAFALYR